MKIQNGVDIIEVDRIKEAIESQGEIFLNKVYTQNEINYCKDTNKMKYQHYAARFAAKEAVFKAISSKIENNKQDIWKSIEILNDENGKPIVNISKLNLKNITSMDLSITHIKEYAIAMFSIIFED